MSGTTGADADGARSRGALLVIVLVHAALLAVAGVRNRHQIDPDGIAYMENAAHWAAGRFGDGIAGYWGPMLSWLMAPVQALTGDMLWSARFAMFASGVVFLLGSVAALRAMRLPPCGVVLGAVAAAVASVAWSVHVVKPDLLLGGLFGLASAWLLREDWADSRSAQVRAGLLLGLCYLAKPVGFALGLGVPLVFAGVSLACGRVDRRGAIRAAAGTLGGFAVVALPWVLVLSVHFGRPMFSTSGAINHAIEAPSERELYHPFFEGVVPPPQGRMSAWEDPSPDLYTPWSPFANWHNVSHQASLVRENLRHVQSHLRDLDLFGIGLLAVLAAFAFHRPWRENLRRDRWRWAAVPVLCVAGVYLPVHADDRRFFYAAYPFLVGGTIGMAGWLLGDRWRATRPRVIALAAVGIVFLGATTGRMVGALRGEEHQKAFEDLALRMEARGVRGTMVGADYWRGWYVAFFLRTPWYASDWSPTAQRLLDTGAEIAVLRRRSEAARRLETAFAADPRFHDLDAELFDTPEEAARCGMKLYRMEAEAR